MRAIVKLAPPTETAKPAVGRYFFGMHDGRMRAGVIIAAVGTAQYTVKFDDVAILPTSAMANWTFTNEAFERDTLEMPSHPDERK